jgi:hypothetical protein
MHATMITGLALALLGGPAAALGGDGPGSESCDSHGTAVRFLDTPSAAARQALKEEKLVFVLHVSGNFEDPRTT